MKQNYLDKDLKTNNETEMIDHNRNMCIYVKEQYYEKIYEIGQIKLRKKIINMK